MPSISINPPNRTVAATTTNPLPSILQTPSGLAMIEFQGSVVTDSDDVTTAQTLDLGRLVFPGASDASNAHDVADWDGKRVFLFVGKHQRLTGEVKKLAKPLAVLRRRRPGDAGAADGTNDDLEIAEIITQKLIFAHRPEPMGGETDAMNEG